jgi:hypothetical protein
MVWKTGKEGDCMSRRGQKIQSGSPAAALIGIITLLFIFYILFLPPAERKELLAGENVTPGAEAEQTLLSVPVGRLAFVPRNQFDHPLPNIYLVETRNAVVLASENPFVVKKGWFGAQKKTMVLAIPDLENTENVVLGFQAPERAGILVIALNGNKIFEGAVRLQNPPPVVLPKTLLQATNELEFSVAGGFFARKRYSLSDVKVIGDITDVKKQMATNTFSIAQVELDNFESGYLDFYPICDQAAVGTLTIELNGKIVSSAVPACESLNRQELYAEDLRSGKNTLIFRISKGSYRIEQVRVRTQIKPVKAFVDFFDVKPSLYNDILDKRRRIILHIEFVDDGRVKRARTNINGKFDMIDQRDPRFDRDISSVIREGNNYIEIQPLAELDVVRLEVRAE